MGSDSTLSGVGIVYHSSTNSKLPTNNKYGRWHNEQCRCIGVFTVAMDYRKMKKCWSLSRNEKIISGLESGESSVCSSYDSQLKIAIVSHSSFLFFIWSDIVSLGVSKIQIERISLNAVPAYAKIVRILKEHLWYATRFHHKAPIDGSSFLLLH